MSTFFDRRQQLGSRKAVAICTAKCMNNPNAIRMANVKYKSGAILLKISLNTKPK